MEELVNQLKVVLATTFSAYLKAHNYHWNVTGPNFAQYHEFFGGYYETVWGSIDGIAEHIRTLDAYVPGSLSRFADLSKIEDELAIQAPEVMFKKLFEANETVREELNVARNLADSAGARAIVNYLEGLLDYHDKMHWMIRSFMVKVAPPTATTTAEA